MFERLQSNRFLVLGRAGMDLYADPPGSRTEEAARFTSALGGSAANIAAGIVRLGGSASLITTVSDDAVGRFCLARLAHYGVGSDHIRMVGAGLRTSLAVVETRWENCQSVIYRNGAAELPLSLLFGTMHECGHGLYEQGVSPSLAFAFCVGLQPGSTPLPGGTGTMMRKGLAG